MKGVVMLMCCVVMVVMVVVVPPVVEGRIPYLEEVRTRWFDLWNRWKTTYGKVYSSRQEEENRQGVFFRNLLSILRHNARYPVSVSYTRGLNQFSDMTIEEVMSHRLRRPINRNRTAPAQICGLLHQATDQDLPDTVDWRTKGWVTPVKDKGMCWDTYAFATTGAVEGQYFNTTGTLLSLSEQQIIDCSWQQGNGGCNTGYVDRSFNYIITATLNGLMTEEDYPYTGVVSSGCYAVASKEKANIYGCVDVKRGSEEALKHAVATIGPVAVTIDDMHPNFLSYHGGIYYEEDCSNTTVIRGMLAVGYGTYQGQDYWLLKDAIGTNWGIKGYMMLARNRGNNCGVATLASYPTNF